MTVSHNVLKRHTATVFPVRSRTCDALAHRMQCRKQNGHCDHPELLTQKRRAIMLINDVTRCPLRDYETQRTRCMYMRKEKSFIVYNVVDTWKQ